MTNDIEVEVKDVYGAVKYYPICEKAQLFADIAGTKTLTLEVLKKIEALGYSIKASRTVTF
jgi:ATP phosphoribosyltransferase